MSRDDIMSPESRIVFEVMLLVTSLGFLLARTWVLRTETPVNKSNSNNRISTLSARITGTALWLTILIMLGVMGSNVWTMAIIIKYRDSDVPIHPYFKVPFHLVEPVLKITFALKFFYITILYLIKVAFLGIFIKFLNHVSRIVRIAIRLTIALTIICFFLSLGLTAFWCLPFSSNWQAPLCSSFHSIPITSILTACNILTDLLIMAPPLLIFRSLRLQRRELLGMFIIFTLGMICIIAACVRLHFLLQFINSEGEEDQPSQQNEIVVASELEVCIAIWAGCLPAMRTLVRRRGGTSRSGGNSGAGKLSQLGTGSMAPGPSSGGVTTYITAGKSGNLERKTSVFGKKSNPTSPISPSAQGNYTSVDPRATPQGAIPLAYNPRPHPTHTRSASHVSFGREHKPQQPSLNTRQFTPSPSTRSPQETYPLDELESPNRYSPQATTPGGYRSISPHMPSPLSPPPPQHQQLQRPTNPRGYTAPAPMRYPSTNRGGASRRDGSQNGRRRGESIGQEGRGNHLGERKGRTPYHSSSTEEFNGESPRPASQGVGIEDEYRGEHWGRSRDGSGGSIV